MNQGASKKISAVINVSARKHDKTKLSNKLRITRKTYFISSLIDENLMFMASLKVDY